jgi:hypothetical protein
VNATELSATVAADFWRAFSTNAATNQSNGVGSRCRRKRRAHVPASSTDFRRRSRRGRRIRTSAELADAERISRSYVRRVLRVTLLAPDIVERILDGRPIPSLSQLLEAFPVQWEKQREQFLAR